MGFLIYEKINKKQVFFYVFVILFLVFDKTKINIVLLQKNI